MNAKHGLPNNIEVSCSLLPARKRVLCFDPRAVHLRKSAERPLTVDGEDEEHFLASLRIMLLVDLVDLLADFVARDPGAALHRDVHVV